MDEVYFLYDVQVELLLFKIEEMKVSLPNFEDSVAESFAKQVLEQANEISKMPKLLVRLNFMDCAKYQIPVSMIDYLCSLTETDIFDDGTMNNFEKEAKEFEDKLVKELKLDNKKHL